MTRPRAFRILAILVGLYIVSYAVLSRVGYRYASAAGIDRSFLYVPGEVGYVADSERLMLLHRGLCIFYAPVWFVDYHAFGGRTPLMDVIVRVTGTRRTTTRPSSP